MARRRLTRRQRERIQKIQERRRHGLSARAAQEAETLSEGGLGPPQTGLVIANYGPAVVLEDRDGELRRCAVRQNLAMLVPGDRVVWQSSGEGEGVVTALEERRSLLSRPDYSGRLKALAANLDRVVIVVAPRPEPSEFLIDRYLVASASVGADPLLAVNKVDLLHEQGLAAITERFATYARIGCPLLFLSVRTESGLSELREHLAGHTGILVGQSGVGKSSLIKALLPTREIRIRALSEATGRGTHTTTTTTLYHLPDGGDLIDSPGVRSFELGEPHREDLERGFPDLVPYLGRCQFSDCSHTVEPGCALREAADRGDIDPRRLQSYRRLKASLQADSY